MENRIYSRLVEERLIERFKKEFYQKTGKVLRVEDYSPEGLPFPVIGLMQLETVLNDFIPPAFESIMDETRIKEVAYPRMLFCNLAYNMGYRIRAIATYTRKDRSTIYHAIDAINDMLVTREPYVIDLYEKVINQINTLYNEPTLPDVCEQRYHTESALHADML